MKPQDLDRLRLPAEPRLHPKDDIVVFTVTRPHLEKDRYDTTLWIRDHDVVHPLAGAGKAWSPAWSPGGRRLACLAMCPDDPDGKKSGEHPQVVIHDHPLAGGPTRRLTSFELGASSFSWSPDGSRMAVLAPLPEEGWAGLDAEGRGKKPRRITAVPWRYDSSSTLDDRRTGLFLVDPTEQRAPRDLSRHFPAGVISVGAVAWHPKGKALAVIGSRYVKDRTRLEDVVFLLDVDRGKATEIHTDGSFDSLLFLGETLIGLGLPHVYDWPNPSGLYRLAKGKKPAPLLPDLDRSIDAVKKAGDALVFLYQDQGHHRLARLAGEEMEDLHPDTGFVSDFDVRDDGELVFVAGGPTDPGEVHRASATRVEKLTRLGDDFRRDVRLTAPEHFVTNTKGAEVDTWVFLPRGKKPAPVLLNIHGGPATQYGFNFFDEFQVYVDAGYAVVACNPRGSSGRGSAHLRGVMEENWGVVDMQDILACLDAALARFDRLDRKRVGVMGGSYGGFMTAWLIAQHPKRFKSAVVERGLLYWPTFCGTSDIATVFPHMYMGVGPTDRDILERKSPLTHAAKTKSPTLIIHSEQDWRCPIEQAEQYFHALLRTGVETEFLRFPGESHELSRSGNPKHRVERFQAILAWHDKHLRDAK